MFKSSFLALSSGKFFIFSRSISPLATPFASFSRYFALYPVPSSSKSSTESFESLFALGKE